MKTTIFTACLISLATLFVPISGLAQMDRAAFEAAAESCRLPQPGQGVPTEAEENCMEKAGFKKPDHPSFGDQSRNGEQPSAPQPNE